MEHSKEEREPMTRTGCEQGNRLRLLTIATKLVRRRGDEVQPRQQLRELCHRAITADEFCEGVGAGSLSLRRVAAIHVDATDRIRDTRDVLAELCDEARTAEGVRGAGSLQSLRASTDAVDLLHDIVDERQVLHSADKKAI